MRCAVGTSPTATFAHPTLSFELHLRCRIAAGERRRKKWCHGRAHGKVRRSRGQSMRAWPQALLAPRSVAIVGQSDDAGKTAGRPLKYLRQAKFARPIYSVNARRTIVLG